MYARLWSLIGGSWQSADYTYTETQGVLAVLTTPTPGSVLGTSNVTFSWTPGTAVTAYKLWLGTTGVGSENAFESAEITAPSVSVTVPSLPASGGTVYARLLSFIGGSWQSTDYTYAEAQPMVNVAKYGATGSSQSTTTSGSVSIGASVPVTSCIDFAAGNGIQIQGTAVTTTAATVPGSSSITFASGAGMSNGWTIAGIYIQNQATISGLSGNSATLSAPAYAAGDIESATPVWVFPFYVGNVASCAAGTLTVTPATTVAFSAGALVQHDDAAAINAASAALLPLETLFIPPGTFNLGAPVVINELTEQYITGPGTLIQTIPNQGVLQVENVPNFVADGINLQGLGFDYVNTVAGHNGARLLALSNTPNPLITNSHFTNWGGDAVHLEDFVGAPTSNVKIVNSYFTGPGPAVIPLGGNGNFVVDSHTAGLHGITFSNNHCDGVGTGVELGEWSGFVYTGNYCNVVGQYAIYSYADDGIVAGNNDTSLYTVYTFRKSNLSLNNTVGLNVGPNVISAPLTGMQFNPLTGSTTTFVNLHVHDNTVITQGTGILLENSSGSTTYDFQNASVQNNVMSGSTGNGVVEVTASTNCTGGVVGTVGQTVLLSSFNNASSGATATGYLTAANTIVGANWVVTAYGTGATASPTSATCSAGTATSASGTSTLTTSLGGGNGILALGLGGAITGNTLNTFSYSCILANTSTSLDISGDNVLTNCGAFGALGLQYQSYIYVGTGTGTAQIDGNRMYTGGGTGALASIASSMGSTVEIGPSNTYPSSLPQLLYGTVVAWPPVGSTQMVDQDQLFL